MTTKTAAQRLIPGDALPVNTNRTTRPGPGTHLSAPNTLRSSLSGTLATPTSKAPLASILRPSTASSSSSSTAALPSTGDVILGRITRTGPRFATLDILCSTSLSNPSDPSSTVPYPYAHQALIRQQDIRATEVDKVTVAGSFKVGDLVRGTVISVGDERNYYVTTVGDGMGVILGRGDDGEELVGVSWREMVGEEGRREGRKVAKVI